MLIFEQSQPQRINQAQQISGDVQAQAIPEKFLRKDPPTLPEVSELQTVRHYTRLSQKNFSIDTHFYPLGSCTMKYNPRPCNTLALLPGFTARHPLSDTSLGQGILACLFDLQEVRNRGPVRLVDEITADQHEIR